MGVEPTGDGVTRRPPVLKTGTITGPHALPNQFFGFDSRERHPESEATEPAIESKNTPLA